MKTTILVVDDEPDALELIEFNLKRSGFEVAVAADGEEGIRKARILLPALIILDVMMPGMSGLETCKLLKREAGTERIPIIMVSARAAEIDRLLGLELGADDYVTKPFSPRELVLRVRGLLNRRGELAKAQSELIEAGDLVLDLSDHEVRVAGERKELTATEFQLLQVLIQRRGRVQSREQLRQDVWTSDNRIDLRTVDVHMRRLRAKLGTAAKNLETVYGVGYRFTE